MRNNPGYLCWHKLPKLIQNLLLTRGSRYQVNLPIIIRRPYLCDPVTQIYPKNPRLIISLDVNACLTVNISPFTGVKVPN